MRTSQFARVPKGATHLVISVGRNDALGRSAILNEPPRSVAEAAGRLAEAQASFTKQYAKMLDAVLALSLPTAVCTIYVANYLEPHRRSWSPHWPCSTTSSPAQRSGADCR